MLGSEKLSGIIHLRKTDFGKMAINSKYQDKQVDALINDMISVLEKHQAPLDLSLMALGNMVTNLLSARVGENQRIALAQAFSDALMNSVKIQPYNNH